MKHRDHVPRKKIKDKRSGSVPKNNSILCRRDAFRQINNLKHPSITDYLLLNCPTVRWLRSSLHIHINVHLVKLLDFVPQCVSKKVWIFVFVFVGLLTVPQWDGFAAAYISISQPVNDCCICSCVTTDLYINNLDTGLASLSIANGDPFKLTSPAQRALHG